MTVAWNTLLRIWSLRWNYLFSSTFWFLGCCLGGEASSPPFFWLFSGSATTSTVKDFKSNFEGKSLHGLWCYVMIFYCEYHFGVDDELQRKSSYGAPSKSLSTDRKICAPLQSVRAIWRLRIVIGKCEPLNQYVAGSPCQAYERVRLDDLYRRLFEDWLATCSATFGLGGVAPPLLPARFLFGVQRDHPFFIDFNF